MIGNSLTDNVNYEGFSGLIQSRGNTITLGSQRIPGSPLSFLWENLSSGFTHEPYGYPQNAFTVYSWDYLSLQPFDRSIEGAEGDKTMIGNYYNLIKSKSPDCKVSIYGHWPRTPNDKSYQDCTKEEYNTVWLSDTGIETRKFYEDLTLAVRDVYPATAANIILAPIGEVMYELNNNPDFLSAMGITSIWGVYADGIHLNGVGAYISACVNYALMYHDDPAGLGVPGAFGAIPAAALPYIHDAVKNVIIDKSVYTGISYFGPAPVLSVQLNASVLELNTTKTATLVPTFTPSNAANKEVSWSSSDTGVATVVDGVVTAHAVGTADITVTTADGGHQSVCAVTVVDTGTAVTGISLNKATTSILVSDSETLTATIAPENATNQSVVWSSSDNSIATVSASGEVTAVKKGVAEISASSVNGLFTATSTVTVTQENNPPVAVMDYSPGHTGYAPYKIVFDGRSSYDPDPDDFVLGYDWVVKLKDASTNIRTESSNGFEHTFTDPGVYEVTLQAVDNAEQLRSLNTESVTINILEMPEVPASETAICYEGFDYVKAPITNLNGGRGWKEGWLVQNEQTNTIDEFAVDNVNPVTINNLRQAGNYMKLGQGYSGCGRPLDISENGAFQDYLNANGNIGKAGTTLWFSSIIRPQSNNKNCSVSFSNDGGWWTNNSKQKVDFGCFGGDYWGFAFGWDSERVYNMSTVPVVDNVPAFLVAKVEFGATNTVSLYINPAPGDAPTGTPVTGTTTSDIEFKTLGMTFGVGSDQMGLDEIRFGTSYADVAPASAADDAAPTTPTGLAVGNIDNTSVELSWDASVNDVGTTTYDVYEGEVLAGSTTSTTYTAAGLTANTLYSFTVVARDDFGAADATGALEVTTTASDLTPPTIPTDLTAGTITENSVQLTWTASTDDDGIAGYEVYEGATLVGSASGNSFTVTDLLPATNYSFTVKAEDLSGNISDASTSLPVITLALTVVDEITARGENAPGESLANLTDLSLDTKWLDFNATSWVKFSYADAKVWKSYEISSADDAPERDPKDWTIEGSMDGTVWTVLDTRTNQTWESRKQTMTFNLTNTTAYHYYKWDVTDNAGATEIQASEFKFSSSVATGLDNKNQNAGVSVYPNPAFNELNISYGDEVRGADVVILDLQGRVLLAKSVGNSAVHSIDVSELSYGIYLVKITADGKQINSKFIKN